MGDGIRPLPPVGANLAQTPSMRVLFHILPFDLEIDLRLFQCL